MKTRVQAQCPFIDPSFDIPSDVPCPVCGVCGNVEPEEINKMCVDKKDNYETNGSLP